ncbi:hypothetical protein E2C01_025390 [Portunus trituberculatus]|uniref:Uncharacterized protein n=1 Tax=Portunus trituberculatus TaxID=210409 RepID=A0A5B7EFU7_PORTR|nr:hypothetical protein [Portunus trituberculatus]
MSDFQACDSVLSRTTFSLPHHHMECTMDATVRRKIVHPVIAQQVSSRVEESSASPPQCTSLTEVSHFSPWKS